MMTPWELILLIESAYCWLFEVLAIFYVNSLKIFFVELLMILFVDLLNCWLADNTFWYSVYHPFIHSFNSPLIQALIQTFNFHSSLQMNCWHMCWKSISSANENINSIPFLNCLRLAHAVLLCPITSYGTVQKQELLLRCHERREFQQVLYTANNANRICT